MPAVDIREETIFTLLRLPAARRGASTWWVLGALAMVGWLGAVAYLGLYRPNQVARTLYAAAPREAIVYGALAGSLLAAAWLAMQRKTGPGRLRADDRSLCRGSPGVHGDLSADSCQFQGALW